MPTFPAIIREQTGKGASRRLRRHGQIPAVIYGGDKPTVSLTLSHDLFNHAHARPEFYTDRLFIEIQQESLPAHVEVVKVKAIQHHPFKPKLVHIDFVRA